MTDREAYKIACECILAAMRLIAFDAHVGEHDPNAPPGMIRRRERYRELALALSILEGKVMRR